MARKTRQRQKQKVMDFPLVEIVWHDANIEPAHKAYLDDGADKFGELAELRDIGYLVRKNRRELVLAVSRCESENSVTTSNTIPFGWVDDIIYLEPRRTNAPEAPEVGPDAESGPSVQH
jgi:hypothetical protein